MTKWFYARGEERLGPVTQEDIAALLRNGKLDAHNGLVWREGLADWVKPASLPEFQEQATRDSVNSTPSPSTGSTASDSGIYSPPAASTLPNTTSPDMDDLPDIPPGSEPLGISEVIGRGFDLTKRHFGILLGAIAIIFGFSLVTSLLETVVEAIGAFSGENSDGGKVEIVLTILSAIITIAGQLFELFLTLGLIRFGLNFVSGRQANLGMLFGELRLLPRMVGATILYGLMVALGLILLVVPGIYLALKFSQYQYAIVDRNLGVIDSLKYSSEITAGSLWQLLGLAVLLILINLLGVVALCVGLIFTIPLTNVITWLCYRWLQKGHATLHDRGHLAQHPLSRNSATV